jgi:ketosteroid isomerase-like protein
VTNTTDTTFDPVTAFFERSARDDIDGAVDCFTADGVWIMPAGPEPGTTYRRDQIREHLTGLIDARKKLEADQVSFEVGEPLRVADRVIVESRLIAADGTVMDRGVDIFTLRDGLIAVKDVFRKA